jgi:hypothetical protein
MSRFDGDEIAPVLAAQTNFQFLGPDGKITLANPGMRLLLPARGR